MSGTTVNFNAPAFNYVEDDQSQFSLISNSYTAAVVFAAPRGPITPTTAYSDGDIAQFGTVDTTWGYGLVTANEAVQETPVLMLRVVDTLTARYGMMSIVNSTFGADSNITAIVANPNGSQQGYNSPDTAVVVSYYKSNYSTTNQTFSAVGEISFNEISGLTINTTGLTTTSAFQAVNNSLMSYMLTQYETLDPTYTLTGAPSASVLASFVNPAQNTDYMAVMFLDEGIAETSVGQAVWSPNPGNDVWEFSDSWLMHIYAIDPGDWINGQYAVSITNVNAGKPQVNRITLSGTPTPATTISGTITVGTTNYNITQKYSVSSDDTMIALAQAINNAVSGADAVITPLNGQTSGFTAITVSAPNNTQSVTYSNWECTGLGAPTVAISQISAAVAGNGQFNLNVFSTSNTSTPLESFPVTLYKAKDGFGFSLFAQDVINKGLGSKTSASKYIRVVVNSALTEGNVINQTIGINTPVSFAGGNAGNMPEDTAIAAGWQVLADRTNYDFWFAMSGGYNSNTVLTAIADVVNTRADCIGVIDAPMSAFGNEATWMSQAPLVTSYTAVYSPYILESIIATGTQEYIPPSGAVVRAICASAASNTLFVAAAGKERGILTNALGVYGPYTLNGSNGTPTLATCAANRINPIIKNRNGGGYMINDVLTTQSYESLLSFISVRMGFIWIHRAIEQAVAPYDFDNITPNNMYEIEKTLAALLKPLVDAGLLENAGVQCDSQNNPQTTAVTGNLTIYVWGTGYAPIREINCTAFITSTDTSYTDFVV